MVETEVLGNVQIAPETAALPWGLTQSWLAIVEKGWMLWEAQREQQVLEELARFADEEEVE